MSANQHSLYLNLTKLALLEPPKVIQSLSGLLEVAASYACEAKRNQHSLYWTVSTFRDCLDEINDLTTKVTVDSKESWNIFDRYTSMIPNLEGLLLEFCAWSATESLGSNDLSGTDVQVDITFIDAWMKAKTELQKQNENLIRFLNFEPEARRNERTAKMELAYKCDDMNLYRAFVRKWADYPAVSTTLGQENFRSINEKLDAVASRENLPRTFRVQFIRVTMIIDISLSGRDMRVAQLAEVKKFWTVILELVDAVEVSSKGDTNDLSGMESAFENLRNYLIHEPAPPVSNPCFKLLPLLSKIVRPYYAVGLVLVIECRTLHAKFCENRTHQWRVYLDDAIQKTKNTLDAASAVTYDPHAEWKEVATVNASIGAAAASVKKCLTFYDLIDDAQGFENKIKDARVKDQERLEAIQLSKAKTLTKSNDTIVHVELVVAGGRKIYQYSMDRSSTLSSVAWLLRSDSSLPNTTANEDLWTRGKFAVDGNVYDSSTPVAELKNGAEKKIVFSASPK
ncbi:hypothetical protein R3P38DRAFT_3362779 [Favolaschia claudopus]|uniref:Fungal N-terminal domain-containing protein n=1 Tax=Favolaschia claudopus TaxID=2862362 RepID=A0AAW0AMQ9_9AGAR